jgi:tetratricopeptide (TPR) repeat protein
MDWAWSTLGDIEWNQHKNAENAIYCITRSIDISSDYTCHFRRGQIYHATGKYAEAIQDFEKAIQFRKNSRGKIEPLILQCRQELEKQIAANQKLDPTVKTPVESGNEQGTAGQL